MHSERNARLFPGGCEHRAKYADFLPIIKHAKLVENNTDVKMQLRHCVLSSPRGSVHMRRGSATINAALQYAAKSYICNCALATRRACLNALSLVVSNASRGLRVTLWESNHASDALGVAPDEHPAAESAALTARQRRRREARTSQGDATASGAPL